MKLFFPPPIGITIEAHALLAVQLIEEKGIYRLYSTARVALKNNPFDASADQKAFVSSLKQLKKKGGFKGRHVVIALPGSAIYSFPLVFRNEGDTSFEAEMVEALKRHLSFPVEEAIVDYPSHYEIDEDHHQTATMVAVKRAKILALMDQFKDAGLTPCAIEYGLSALIRLDNHLIDLTPKPKILCYIGQHKSIITIVNQDNIFAQRDIKWGVGSIVRRLSVSLGTQEKGDEPRYLLKHFGLAYENTQDEKENLSAYRMTAQLLIPHVEVLVHELHQMMGYVRTSSQGLVGYQGIYLYGYGRKIRDLDSYIEEQMGIKTRCVDSLTPFLTDDNMALFPDRPDVELDIPLGLSLRKVRWL